MPRKNLPPFVQRLRRDDETTRGFRGWAMLGGKRKFGPLRSDAMQAHRDAVVMRGIGAEVDMGGTLDLRAEQWLAEVARTRAPDTVTFYRSCMRCVYRTISGTVALARVTPPVLREFIREAQAKGLGARSIQHCRRALNCLFVWLCRRGFVTSNPVGMVEWPRPENTKPDCLNEVELRGLLQRVADPWANALFTFMAFTGLRRAEMARLRVADVRLDDGVLWVAGKSRAQSHPIPVDATASGEALLRGAREFVVPGSTDRGRRSKIAETFRLWQKRLGEPRLHAHALRHSIATILLRKGVHAGVVQRFLRHSSYAMTQRYVHMVEADVRDATSRLRLLRPDEVGEKAEHG
jgi:site-specific recombinase XerD